MNLGLLRGGKLRSTRRVMLSVAIMNIIIIKRNNVNYFDERQLELLSVGVCGLYGLVEILLVVVRSV